MTSPTIYVRHKTGKTEIRISGPRACGKTRLRTALKEEAEALSMTVLGSGVLEKRQTDVIILAGTVDSSRVDALIDRAKAKLVGETRQ